MDSQTILNPHIIRFYSKKETEYFDIGGKRIPRPSLTGSIPSCCVSKSPLVIKGDNLKPLPGMAKLITVQFIQESTKEMISVTNPLEINICCDKCLTVIAPEVFQNTVYHVRVGINCRKIEKAILNDKNNSLKLDNFIVLDSQHQHQQQQQNHQHVNNQNNNGINILDKLSNSSDGVLEIISHHHHHTTDQAQQQQHVNNQNLDHEDDQQHHQQLEDDNMTETTTLVQITEDSMQIDPKQIEEIGNHDDNNDTEHQQHDQQQQQQHNNIGIEEINDDEIDENAYQNEINAYIFESDEHILWSNEIVIAIDVSHSSNNNNNIQSTTITTSTSSTPPQQPSTPQPIKSHHSVLGKRSSSNINNILYLTNPNPGRKKKTKPSKTSNNSNININNNSNGNNLILTQEVIQQLMNGDIEMIKSYLETRTLENKIVYDFERKDEDGFTPLHYSCAYGMNGLVEYLLKCDVDPNRSDKEGWTPLHWSVKANNLAAIHLLLAYGADQSVPNNSNQYPVEMAFDKGFTLIAATLQGMSEQEFKKNNEPLVMIRESTHHQTYQNLMEGTTSYHHHNGNNSNNGSNHNNINNNSNNINNSNSNSNSNNINNNNNSNNNNNNNQAMIITDNSGDDSGNLNQEMKLLLKHNLEPYIAPDNYNIKSNVIEKHNTLKFIQSAEKLGLGRDHRFALMDAFKSLRTLRYRLFWIMLSNNLFSKVCEWDSDGVNFLVYHKESLLAILGLYFGLRGSNSAIDWMSHLARRKCNKNNGSGSGDVWINLRASTFNSQTNLDKLKDITSEKSDKRKSLTGKDSPPLSQSIEEINNISSNNSNNSNNINNSNNSSNGVLDLMSDVDQGASSQKEQQQQQQNNHSSSPILNQIALSIINPNSITAIQSSSPNQSQIQNNQSTDMITMVVNGNEHVVDSSQIVDHHVVDQDSHHHHHHHHHHQDSNDHHHHIDHHVHLVNNEDHHHHHPQQSIISNSNLDSQDVEDELAEM